VAPSQVRVVGVTNAAHYIVAFLAPSRASVGIGILVGTGRSLPVRTSSTKRSISINGAKISPRPLVTVQFPLLKARDVLTAEVRMWRPPPNDGATGDDVAGLVLTEALGFDVQPARLVANLPPVGTRVRVFGYPGNPP
jgi:hypothetical protein